jgi:hypothetical protein
MGNLESAEHGCQITGGWAGRLRYTPLLSWLEFSKKALPASAGLHTACIRTQSEYWYWDPRFCRTVHHATMRAQRHRTR